MFYIRNVDSIVYGNKIIQNEKKYDFFVIMYTLEDVISVMFTERHSETLEMIIRSETK